MQKKKKKTRNFPYQSQRTPKSEKKGEKKSAFLFY